ncbi:hypothetical protein E2C01_033442 [Portunus trituberculatus]|uniref:Uncharacterized protein n=1 Tax=Portunus trituberculatus TaxID=210409 RepID=A0A5B7EXV8_PORTR|nr:hypothetical protein [Portunus trituberculatus]
MWHLAATQVRRGSGEVRGGGRHQVEALGPLLFFLPHLTVPFHFSTISGKALHPCSRSAHRLALVLLVVSEDGCDGAWDVVYCGEVEDEVREYGVLRHEQTRRRHSSSSSTPLIQAQTPPLPSPLCSPTNALCTPNTTSLIPAHSAIRLPPPSADQTAPIGFPGPCTTAAAAVVAVTMTGTAAASLSPKHSLSVLLFPAGHKQLLHV